MTIAAYRDRVTGFYPISQAEIRNRSDVLFGAEVPKAVMDELGMDGVQSTPPPTYDASRQTIMEGPPTKDGPFWYQTWLISDLPVDPTANFVPVPLLRQRLEKLGLFEDFSAYLAQYPVLMLKVLSLETGVDPAYPDLIAAFDSMNVPQSARNYLLAPPSAGVPDV